MSTTVAVPIMRDQLVERRTKLQSASTTALNNSELVRLLGEVDAALARMDHGTYGLCEACHDPIESDRLIADPLMTLCIDHLTVAQQVALEEDLELAAKIQKELLPRSPMRVGGWEACFHYQAAGPVSGDYCDLVRTDDDRFYFILGDVSGKGIAASMLMAHLQAMFRTLISVGLPLPTIMERASRAFCESTLPTHFATMVCGRANGDGEIEICNAGHLPPLLVHQVGVESIAATGLPMGIFCNEQFTATTIRLEEGDTLFLYTDGLSEARNGAGVEYGSERLLDLVKDHYSLEPQVMIDHCLSTIDTFRAETPMADDLTVMAIRRNGVVH